MNVQGITKQELQNAIDHFEKMGRTYFWNTPSNASARRREEERNSKSWEFTVDGQSVIASVDVRCSCRNYYATRTITVNGEAKKMMVPFLKKVLKEM